MGSIDPSNPVKLGVTAGMWLFIVLVIWKLTTKATSEYMGLKYKILITILMLPITFLIVCAISRD